MEKELIEAATAAVGGNQSELTRRLGLGQNTLTEVKAGRQHLGAAEIGLLAEIAGKNVQETLAEYCAETAKRPAVKSYWTNVVERTKKTASGVASVAVALMFLSGGFVAPQTSQAAPTPAEIAHNVHCVK